MDQLKQAQEIFWINPSYKPDWSAGDTGTVHPEQVRQASMRLQRFAPLIMHYFPETEGSNGIIESDLADIPAMQKSLGVIGRVLLKKDSDLAVAGSVKARGGIYEVLKHAEDLALQNGLLSSAEDDYLKLASQEARDFFHTQKVQVGSTGNLGLSIGRSASALGFHAIVHMSADAKQWKKDLLRREGADVQEYAGDYSKAVASGRALSDADPNSYFVDDEHSVNLFLGYAVAAERLKKQLDQKGIAVDEEHPLFVYIPCGVGGAPGGITYGLKLIFGRHVHCFFAEPTQAPCMVLGIASGKHDEISVQEIGLSGMTAADGLAVGRCSGMVSHIMEDVLSGEATVEDERLPVYQKMLWNQEKIFIEPSSCAAFHALAGLFRTEEGQRYIREQNLNEHMNNAVHIVWATGGSLMPMEERHLD